MDKFKIIIIDDDIIYAEMLKEHLSDYNVDIFSSSFDGLAAIKKENYNLLILDYRVDTMDGSEIVEQIRKFNDRIYILLLTGYAESYPGLKMLKSLDIEFYLEKEADVEKIIIGIESAIKSISKSKEDNYLEKCVNFANRLRELRTAYNVSQDQLAKYLNVQRSQISNYEKGISRPSLDIAEKISDYFGIPLDHLVCRTIKFPDVLK